MLEISATETKAMRTDLADIAREAERRTGQA